MLDGWAMGELVMADSFHRYRRPGPRRTWGLFRFRSPLGGDLFCHLFLFFYGFLKINSFFYLSYWLRLLLIVCGDIESNPGPGSDRRFRVL